MPATPLPDGYWLPGLDSISFQLGQGYYQWAQNVTNRGGLIGTRQGFAQITGRQGETEVPRGITLFSPVRTGVNPIIVVAIGGYVYALQPPYTAALDNTTRIPNIQFPTTIRQVHFETCVQAQKNDSGLVSNITPRFVLIMQDGITNPAYYYYDPTTRTYVSGHVNPGAQNTDNPPWNTLVGTYMKWAGDRLWVGYGNVMYAGDLLNPLQFEERKVTASGGFFFMPGDVTGMGVTHDYKSLLVYTDQTTSAFQVGIEDRTLWPETQDFQRVLFPGIGCASHRTIINQYGMTWWMSHDGIVALDSSLQAYQTSRLQVKDHNMSRSKEGINWGGGGGAAGTFGNWLMFSVPSGSRDNIHTWVIDQSVLDNINAIAAPAWCSNWTGIRPEQWVTGVVNGELRCFCISHDLVTSGHQSTIWETFIGQRMDIPKDGVASNAVRLAKDIGCAIETKFMGLGPGIYAKFRFAEIDIAELVGTARIQVYGCGRKTSYKKILDKQITATVSNVTEEIFDPEDLINVYVPQFRTLRTVTDSDETGDNNTGIQTPFLRAIDKEFSLLITWTGQLSIHQVTMYLDPEPRNYDEGFCEDDETTVRQITAEGTGVITDIPVPPNTFESAFTSKYLAPIRPRWVEFPSYDSSVPNGVFFCAIPSFSPPVSGYPLNSFPLSVSIATETPGATIVYTINGTTPSLDPLNGTVYSTPVSIVNPNITLSAIAFRDHLIPSAMASGVYTQAKAQTPIFAPHPGTYPPDSYPVVTDIRSNNGATIHYIITPSPQPHVTTGSPTYTVPVSVPPNNYLKAKAYLTNYLESDEASGLYVALPQCVTPTFTPDGGSYDAGDYPKNILISTTTTGAALRYTINDSDVTNGTVLANNGHVLVNENDVLRAISQKTGLANSEVKLATYTVSTPTVAQPTLSPDGGTFNQHSIQVRFNCSTPDATMAYTIGTGGQEPGDPTHDQTNHRVHNGDLITIQLGHVIIKVIGFESGFNDSVIHRAEFDFDPGG